MLGRFNKTEKMFDAALKRMKDGEDISAILSAYPEVERADLQSMLEVANSISSLPTKQVPAPTKRRLYLEHAPARFTSFVFFIRKYNLAPLVMAIVVFTATGTAYGATYALPGENLFFVKRTFEKVQVKLTTNLENKAVLQVQIAAQRLEDAQKVISKNENEETKAVALKELENQTVVALNNIKSIATDTSVNTKTPELVDQVVKINDNKNTLIAKESPETAKKSEAATKVVLQDLKKILAATDEQTAAKIATPDTVEASGNITSIKGSVIRVGGNDFEVDAETTKLTQKDGTPLTLKDLSTNDTVSITADIVEKKNIAVIIIRSAKAPAVQGANTEAPATETNTNTVPLNTSPVTPTPPKTTIPEKPKDTFGGFILEPIVNEE